MLFSKPEIADFINLNFEPAWESVRPVPIIRIDFGNGTVLTRTLHGNIATYVCTPEGQVLDAVAGIYTPSTYRQRLDQFRLLANYVDQLGKDKREARLREYHQGQLSALAGNEVPPVFVNMDMSKARIEGRLKAVLLAAMPTPEASESQVEGALALGSAADLAHWKLLADDTQQNESLRRKQVHEKILARGLTTPAALTRPIYKDILHADLDDPYLGLGGFLSPSYPFKD